MKEFIWKVCCLIWHFDDRVIREYEERMGNVLKRYKEEQYKHLKYLEETYWESYQKDKASLDELKTHNIQIEEDNFVPYQYGSTLANAINSQNFWNDIYDELCHLGYELEKHDDLAELRKKRN